MPALFAPAVRLMQRLRLLPKFLVVSAVFLLPLLLATGFLMMLDAIGQRTAVLERIRAVETAQRMEIAALNAVLDRIDRMNRRNAVLTAAASAGASRVHEECTLLNGALQRFRLRPRASDA